MVVLLLRVTLLPGVRLLAAKVAPKDSLVVQQALEVPVDLRVAKAKAVPAKGGPEDSRAARPALTAAPVDLPVVRQVPVVSWADLVVPEASRVVRQVPVSLEVPEDLRVVRQAQAASQAAPVAQAVLPVVRRVPQDLTPVDSGVLVGLEDLRVVRQDRKSVV